MLLLAGCQTTAMVRVDVEPDGSGSVAVDVYLDAEAAARVGDLSKILAVDDLKKAGWKIVGPASVEKVRAELGEALPESGERRATAVQIHLEHPFADVAEANEVLSSLSGPDGPLSDVALTRTSSLFKTDLGFTGTVDLSRGLDAFGDVDLTKALGGSLSDTVAASGVDKPSGGDLTVGLQLGSGSTLKWSGEMGNRSMGDKVVAASAGLGDAPESVNVHASKTRWGAVIAVGGFVLVVLLGLVVGVARARRRSTRRRYSPRPSRIRSVDIEVPDPFAVASGGSPGGAGVDPEGASSGVSVIDVDEGGPMPERGHGGPSDQEPEA